MGTIARSISWPRRGALARPATLAVSLLALLAAGCDGGGGGGGGASAAPLVRDDVRGRALNFPNGQVHPLAFALPATGGNLLLAVNQPGARLVALSLPDLSIVAEIPAGPGLTSVAVRPGTDEVWVVDWWTSSVAVVDLASRSIQHTVRVGAGAVALAFTPSGDRAYVTCSQVDRVDVIEAATYSVVNSVPVPAREPSGVVFHQGHAWVASLRSGNGSAPRGSGPGAATDDVVAIGKPGGPGEAPLPDRDLFAIRAELDPRLDAIDPARTVGGLGTTLFSVAVHPTTGELWIPHTDALNADFRGSVNFPEGQVVRNRIAIVDPTGAVPARFVDLDALAPAGLGCAQPTGVAFTPDGARAFVCGFGSDAVAVLDLAGGTPQWAGTIHVPAITEFPLGSGPRAAVVDAAGANLFVFDKLANAVTPVALAALPATAPFEWTAPVPATLGSNPLSFEERQGRAHFVNARHSASGTSSCASCHVEGATDGLAWDLSDFLDPEGTPSDALALPIDDKGPLVTQETLQLAETAPYHWRGERSHLALFDSTFPTLLERRGPNGFLRGIGDQFPYIRHYMQLLVRRPNPHQAFDRRLRDDEARGATLFQQRPLAGGVSCAGCHQLPLGTSGEVVTTPVGSILATAVIPQLRGLAEKLTPPHTVGGDYGERSELGAGLLHGGSAATLEDAIAAHLTHLGGGGLTPEELADLAAFLRAFDTGIAPAAAFQITLSAGNADGPERGVLDELMDRARAGDCDVVAYRGPDLAAGATAPRTESWDRDLDRFVPASVALPPRDVEALVSEARGGVPVTFLGVPLGMGRMLALDRDSDGLLDLDEELAGTDPELPDTDNDGYPDGYEVAWGMNPLVPNTSSPDAAPPALRGPVRMVYRTATSAKLELETTEPARIHVTIDGVGGIARLPLRHVYDDEFSFVLPELHPGTTYTVRLRLYDPDGNEAEVVQTVTTAQRRFAAPVFVEELDPTIVDAPGGGKELRLRIVFARDGRLDILPGYALGLRLYHKPAGSPASEIGPVPPIVLQRVDGVLTAQFPLPDPAALGGHGKLHVVVDAILPPPGAPPYALAYDTERHVKLDF